MHFSNWLSGHNPLPTHRARIIEVHHYKVFDPETGKWVVPPLKSTAKRIAELNGEIIAGTMDVVGCASVDKDGQYDPKK